MMDCQCTCGPRQCTRLDDAARFKLRLYREFRHPCACVSEQEVDQVCQVLEVCVIGEERALDITSVSINRLVEQGRHDGMEHSPAVEADPVLRREKLPNGQQHLWPKVAHGLVPQLAFCSSESSDAGLVMHIV